MVKSRAGASSHAPSKVEKHKARKFSNKPQAGEVDDDSSEGEDVYQERGRVHVRAVSPSKCLYLKDMRLTKLEHTRRYPQRSKKSPSE